jgi:hypothetical protein
MAYDHIPPDGRNDGQPRPAAGVDPAGRPAASEKRPIGGGYPQPGAYGQNPYQNRPHAGQFPPSAGQNPGGQAVPGQSGGQPYGGYPQSAPYGQDPYPNPYRQNPGYPNQPPPDPYRPPPGYYPPRDYYPPPGYYPPQGYYPPYASPTKVQQFLALPERERRAIKRKAAASLILGIAAFVCLILGASFGTMGESARVYSSALAMVIFSLVFCGVGFGAGLAAVITGAGAVRFRPGFSITGIVLGALFMVICLSVFFGSLSDIVFLANAFPPGGDYYEIFMSC